VLGDDELLLRVPLPLAPLPLLLPACECVSLRELVLLCVIALWRWWWRCKRQPRGSCSETSDEAPSPA